ncbi:hypothetical protein PG993_004620 [Apiospora rasikravindrae]|uniref:non-specific serine/threonine protein kinase n=1 Tax=Apiospora rasikravindrae TaxID=990691 RepID=A0ABR1TDA2_9PEZI
MTCSIDGERYWERIVLRHYEDEFEFVVRLFSLGSDALDTAALNQIRDHFNSAQYPRFAYEGVAGRGVFGTTYRVRETLPGPGGAGGQGETTRWLAVKRAAEKEKEALRNEVRWLKELRGSEHIVHFVASRDDGEKEEKEKEKQGPVARLVWKLSSLRVSNNKNNNRGNKNVKEALKGLEGPVLVMEYLANGDLGQMYYRTVKYDLVVPNRVLWSILLCLVRACIAMAYPGKADKNAEPCREEIPSDGTPPSNIEHGDLHMGNIMIGDFARPSSEGEHGLVPVLKLIDFGMAKESKDAVQENLFSISKVLINLIARKVVPTGLGTPATGYKGYRTWATEILPPQTDDNPFSSFDYKYATLDPELRDLIARCLAQDPGKRPGLAEMLREVQAAAAAAADKSATARDEDVMETDDAIHAFLQRALYDAEDDTSENEVTRKDPFGDIGGYDF